MTNIPLSLYVHLPWCVKKCPYCDFNSHRAGDAPPKARYIKALLEDLGLEAERAGDRPLESVFLGGGTPSLFDPEEIGVILDAVKRNFALVDDIEITMEANPGTVECGAPAGYRHAGVTRLSIGAQSFDDDMLGRLGRIHSSADIVRSVAEAKEGGFDNFNVDVMHGLPGQTVEAALADLAAAVDLGPTHLSWYQLTLEPNTVFHARPPEDLPDDELCDDIQRHGFAFLENAGFDQYEVSAYARDGRQCRHNLNYWSFGDYLAVGAGAHGKISQPGAACRYVKPAHPLQYITSVEREELPPPQRIRDADLVFEFMLNALRLNDGFSEELFEMRTGLDRSDLDDALRSPRRKGLIAQSAPGRWRPTALGRRFLNDLQAEFVDSVD